MEQITKKIYKEYPLVWEKLKDKHNKKALCKGSDVVYYYSTGNIYFATPFCRTIIIPFNMLYGLLEDFFEENGINIELKLPLTPKLWSKEKVFRWHWALKDKESIIGDKNNDWSEGASDTKNEAKYNAILKASEILNKRLEGGNGNN